MLSSNEKITVRQLQALLILDIFGSALVMTPGTAAKYAGEDGWVCVLTGVAFAMIYAYFITASFKKSDGFVQYTSAVLGNFLGIVISVLFAVRIMLRAALELRFFAEAVKKVMLNHVPVIIVLAVMVFLSAYTAAKGFEARARLGEILIFAVTVPLFIVFAVAAFQVDYSNLLPFLYSSPESILKTAFRISLSFSAFEFFMIAAPYLNTGKGAGKGVLKAVLASGVMVAATTAITTARFGASNLEGKMWPVIDMMDMLNLPGAFLERQGALIMSFWIIAVFVFVSAGLLFPAILLKDTVKRGKTGVYAGICAVIVLVLSCLPSSLSRVLEYMDTLSYTGGLFFSIVFPALIFLTSKIRGIK